MSEVKGGRIGGKEVLGRGLKSEGGVGGEGNNMKRPNLGRRRQRGRSKEEK